MKKLGTATALAGLLAVAPATASPAVSPTAAVAASGDDSYIVRVATFNILSSAMARGGLDRARRAAGEIQEHRSRVVSLQEVAADQYQVLRNRLPGYDFWPMRKLGTRNSAIQMLWKRDMYRMVTRGAIYAPNRGYQRAVPWVRLEDRVTGRDFFVIGIHNAPGSHERERDIETAKQIDLIHRLEGKGRPIFAIGDVNERDEFCWKLTRQTGLVSMNNGTWNSCPVPRHAGPDWMMGTDRRVTYDGFIKDYNRISDHPMVRARALVMRTS